MVGQLPRPTPMQRWLVLIFVSLAMFGNYYVYDALGPVIDLLREQLDFSYRQIGMLSTAYNVAALLMLLIGGYIIDRFGTKQAIFVFATICLLAAALTAATPHFEVILAGRFLLGLGAEPLIVAATTAGYAQGIWFYTALASLGLFFSWQLWHTETGPGGHGLEGVTMHDRRP